MRNLVFKRYFDIVDCTLASMKALSWGIDSERSEEYINIILQLLQGESFSIKDKYVLENIMEFLYEYKYRFESKFYFSSYIHEHFSKMGYETEHSARNSIDKNKRSMIADNSILCRYFSDTFESISKKKVRSISVIDGKILIHSIKYYGINPYKRNSLADFKKFVLTKDFENIDKYFFEKIYHPIFISEIMSFYYDFRNFLSMLNDEIIRTNDRRYLQGFKFQSKYFDAFDLIQMIRKDAAENFFDCNSVYQKYMYKADVLCKMLCRLSNICNVYDIQDTIINFIKPNIMNISNEELMKKSLNEYLSKLYFKDYASNEIFYYYSMSLALNQYTKKKTYEESFSVLLQQKDYFKNSNCFLKDYIQKIEQFISAKDYNLHTDSCLDEINDKDNIFPKIVDNVYYISKAWEKNNLDSNKIFNDNFRIEYNKLLGITLEKLFDDKLQDYYKAPLL